MTRDDQVVWRIVKHIPEESTYHSHSHSPSHPLLHLLIQVSLSNPLHRTHIKLPLISPRHTQTSHELQVPFIQFNSIMHLSSPLLSYPNPLNPPASRTKHHISPSPRRPKSPMIIRPFKTSTQLMWYISIPSIHAIDSIKTIQAIQATPTQSRPNNIASKEGRLRLT